MRACRKVRALISSILKLCKMPLRVSKSALTVEKKRGVKRQITTDTIVVVYKAILYDTKIEFWSAAIAFLLYPTIKKFCGYGGYLKNFCGRGQKIS